MGYCCFLECGKCIVCVVCGCGFLMWLVFLFESLWVCFFGGVIGVGIIWLYVFLMCVGDCM